ncbi:MAG: tetratricopeptide repeat protein [Kiritimatiellae bacterium]|nr:tetratricopeptide repeat protein [Kiritimatiellia bacterium]
MNPSTAIGPRSEADRILEERAADARLFRRNLVAAAFVFGVALLVYLAFSLRSFALPGEPAEALAGLSGARPNLMERYAVWRHVVSGVVALAPSSCFVAAANLFHAAVSALAVALIYLVFAQLFLRMADRDVFEQALGGDPSVPLWRISLAGGLAAALALAFCAPWWSTAAQVYPYSFHLAWLLLSALCLLRFGATGSLGWMAAFALLHGAGMSQASCFVGWAPVFFLYAVFVLWGEEKLTPRTFLALAVLGILPAVLLLCWNASEFSSSPGAAVLGSDRTFGYVFRSLARSLLNGVYKSVNSTYWTILVGLSVAPWIASLLVGRRAVNGEGGVAMGAMHLAIAATTLSVVLDLRHSPWRLVEGFEHPILPYAMTALSAGYLVAVSLAAVLHLAGRAREAEREPRVRGPAAVILAVAGAILLYAVWNDSDDASLRPWSFLPRYADATLDDMDGREWLVTPGLFDANLMLRARERGIPFHPVDLADQTSRSAAVYRDALPDVGLRNTAEVGTFALLTEWISKRDDAPDALAFAVTPHFWQLGSYADVPCGIVFAGMKPEEAAALPLGPVAERVRARMDALQPLFDAIPTNAHRRVLGYSGVARAQISMAGNNAAFLLLGRDLKEEAFDLFERVRTFDPKNLSATLNWIRLVRGGIRPGREADVAAAVAQLAARPPEDGWSLASRSGYVADPIYFARLGLSWAASGQANPALQSLGEAFESIAPQDQGAIRRKMADLFLSGGNFAASEEAYRKILEEDPADRNAILALFRIALFRGRFDEARSLLESARIAGVPGARILFETATADLLAGSVDRARAIAQRLLELDPAGTDARLLLAQIHASEAERCDKAGDAEGRAAAVAALRGELAELAKSAVADDPRFLVLSARASVFEDKPADARAELLAALKAAGQSAVRAGNSFDPVPLLSEVLALDFRLADRKSGVAHAKEVLRRAPDHPFANWVMGSNALEFDRVESAEAFLERVLRASPDHLYALNDLAFAKFRLRKYDEAEALARRTIELEPRWGGAWDTLGCVMLARGDASAARDALDNAMKLDNDNDPRFHLHYAQVLEAQGELDRARTIVRGLLRARDSFNGQDRRELDEIASRFRVRD